MRVIVWKTLIDICLSIKSSLWALTAAYIRKIRRMMWSMIWAVACGHRSRSPMCTVTSSKRRETSLGKSWKHTTLWFLGGSSHTGAEAKFWLRQPWCNLPLFFPHPPSDFCPSSFLTRVWSITIKNCGIKDVCRLVLEHFDGLMRLVIFPWNKKVNSPAKFPYLFCRPIFPCCILRRRGCLWTPLVAVYQKANPAYPGFYNGGGSRRGDMARGPGDLTLNT